MRVARFFLKLITYKPNNPEASKSSISHYASWTHEKLRFYKTMFFGGYPPANDMGMFATLPSLPNRRVGVES